MSSEPDEGIPDIHQSLQGILRSLCLADSMESILFSLLQDRIRDVIFVLEVLPHDRYRFIHVNAAFEATTGLPPAAVLGKFVDEVVPSESIGLVRSHYRRALDTKQSVSWDEVSEYPSGTKVGEVTVTPILSPEGKCTALIGTVHDVTERHHAQMYLAELEERSRLALEASHSGAFDWHRQTNEISLSEHCRELLGYVSSRFQLDMTSLGRLVHPEDLSNVIPTIQRVVAGELPWFSAEFRLRHLHGHWIWLRCQGRSFQSPDGNVNSVYGAVSDITAEKEAEEAMERASLVFAHSSEAIAIADAAGHIIMVNPGFTRMRGYRKEEIIGQTSAVYDAHIDRDNTHVALNSALNAAGHWKGEVWSRHKDGHLIVESRSVTAVRAGDGSVRNYIEIAADITKAKTAEKMFWRHANYDSLTGLPNRHLFLDRMQQAIRNSYRRGHAAFSVLFIDLDEFREVNDTLGHTIGDRLLNEAAQRLLHCSRDTDTVARLGGDEFTILLAEMHNTDDEDANVIERVAHCVIEAMREPFHIDGETLRISASIGITHYPKDAHDVESLLKHADQAMYEAKRLGKNRFVYFSHAMQVRAQHRRRMADDLRLAIERRQLHVHYQPIVDLSSGRIVKAEALLRWEHPELGSISPAEFIPLAEETGMIIDIGEWVFHVAVSDAARWIVQHGISIQVSVNVSPVQIAKGQESCARCLAFLEAQCLPNHAVSIEITEGTLLENDAAVMRQLQQLGNHGIAISIDDFGTGYSALSYLQNHQFNFLKIDRAFVRNIQKHNTKFALCKTMVAMAHALGMRVIAEGIEDIYEAELLRDAECDYGQGYYFYRPMLAARLEKLLLSQ